LLSPSISFQLSHRSRFAPEQRSDIVPFKPHSETEAEDDTERQILRRQAYQKPDEHTKHFIAGFLDSIRVPLSSHCFPFIILIAYPFNRNQQVEFLITA
jgi:hypothetical protein